MKRRNIIKTIRGQQTTDGAGVRLIRVLGYYDVEDFDPFLMLDSFDTTNPGDYLAGFPHHPHRGIETITYLISGKIEHEDSLGNKGTIHAGESQWMTAGSGIIHQEMPQEAGRMLGFQLWLNLPRAQKMTAPAYLSITQEMIPLVRKENAEIRVISGRFEEAVGVTPHHIPVSIYDVTLKPGAEIEIPTKFKETVFVFLIEGDGVIAGQEILSKTAVLFGPGQKIVVAATPEAALRFIFFSGKALDEPVAWGGPIVMNTKDELDLAFEELRGGTFIKQQS